MPLGDFHKVTDFLLKLFIDDQTRSDGVAAHTLATVVRGNVFGQGDHGSLGNAIGYTGVFRHDASTGSGVDDRTATLAEHMRNRMFGRQVKAAHIGCQGVVPDIDWRIYDSGIEVELIQIGERRVVVENINAPESIHRVSDQGLDGFGTAGIKMQWQGVVANGCCHLDCGLLEQICNHYPGAFGSHALRRGGTDTATTTGNNGYQSFQSVIHYCDSWSVFAVKPKARAS